MLVSFIGPYISAANAIIPIVGFTKLFGLVATGMK